MTTAHVLLGSVGWLALALNVATALRAWVRKRTTP